MLEVKNLTKIYKTKGDNVTKALDDVSLQFPDKGMVFLLGKSGSGKSTLLNLIGGLDNATSGEIIVKGRSSDTFSGSDFDSYRNTFIGFIFQEYNILNEFTVEDNIALALELQGKPKDKERIHELLEQVDLANYAKRKPNTLSGGQKQRIAIARALIKDPEIIMADEPTGALDSTTGRQVFETLKKLSETKLVIIVSHDRDFAEIYANRIIELKDGKILSDVTKSAVAAKQIGNVSFIDDNTLSIKDGSLLSKDDLSVINDYLLKNNQEILISGAARDITVFKQNTGITSEGRETFTDTKAESIEAKKYNGDNTKFIKSRLPVRHATKMGASSLKLKPFRLLFTILLSSIAFILLGVVSTLMFYNYDNVTATSISGSDIEYISVSKGYKYTTSWNGEESTYKQTGNTLYTKEDVNDLKSKYNNVIPVYTYSKNTKIGDYFQTSISIENLTVPSSASSFYLNSSAGFSADFDKTGLSIIAGEKPKTSSEVLVSSYTYECIKKGTLRSLKSNDTYTINNYSDLIGKKIMTSVLSSELTVTGIYDVEQFIPEKFSSLKEESSSYNNNQWLWQQEVQAGIYSIIFVTDSFYQDNLSSARGSGNDATYIPEVRINNEEPVYGIRYFKDTKSYNASGTQITSIADNQVALSARIYASLIERTLSALIEEHEDDYTYLKDYRYSEFDSVIPSYQEKLRYFGDGRLSEYVNDEWVYTDLTEEQRLAYLKETLKYLSDNGIDVVALNSNLTLQQAENGNNDTLELIGFYFDNTESLMLSDKKSKSYEYVDKYTNTYSSKYTINENGIYTTVLIKNSHDYDEIKSMFAVFNAVGSDDSCYVVNSYLMSSLSMVDELVKTLTKVFLWVGIVLAVFATLLLFNFISMSISNKKKEIGILRAVGARGMDVFKIFFSESFIIVAICVVIAIVGSAVICNVINASVAKAISGVRIFVFGPGSIAIIVGLALLVTLLSTFLPVYNFAKKKPVDSIRAL